MESLLGIEGFGDTLGDTLIMDSCCAWDDGLAVACFLSGNGVVKVNR